MTVNHSLEAGSFDQCHARRMPITEQEKTRKLPRGYFLFALLWQGQRRAKALCPAAEAGQTAKARGESHIGSAAQQDTERRRAEKARRQASAQSKLT